MVAFWSKINSSRDLIIKFRSVLQGAIYHRKCWHLDISGIVCNNTIWPNRLGTACSKIHRFMLLASAVSQERLKFLSQHMIDESRKLTQMVTFMYGLCSGGNGYDSRFGSGLFRLSFSVVLLSRLQGKLWYVIKIWARHFPLMPFPIHYSLIVQQFDPDRRRCWSGNALDLHSGEYRFESMPGHRMYWVPQEIPGLYLD